MSRRDDVFHYVSHNDSSGLRNLIEDKERKHDLDLNQMNVYGHTALTVAGTTLSNPIHTHTPTAWHGYLDVCRVLIEAGANVNAEDQDGERPLHWCCGGGHPLIVKLLLQSRADPNCQDHTGQTPIHWAAANGNVEVLRVMLDLAVGLDLSVRNNEGERPRDVAPSGLKSLLAKAEAEDGAHAAATATAASEPDPNAETQRELECEPLPVRVSDSDHEVLMVGFVAEAAFTFTRGNLGLGLPYPAQPPASVLGPASKPTSQSDVDAGAWIPPAYEIDYDEIEIGERIGIGAFGEVLKGTWRGTEVAVKRLLIDDVSCNRIAFRKELDVMQGLRHPNIVQMLGGCTAPGSPMCLVTEHMARGNLYDVLHSESIGPIPWDRLLKMAYGAAKGLAYLHNHRPPIMHRDLKSPNLLVDEHWTVKVADFGYTREQNVDVMSQCGTPQWMSPEMLRGDPYDEKSDVYSFAIILWEMATRRRPYEDALPTQVIGYVAYRVPGLRPIIPHACPPNYATLVRQCWSEDPSLRPSFLEIVATLREMIGGM